MNDRNQDTISASVMDQIKSGKVRMKPRAYYVALSVASVGAVILAGISIAYLSSIMFYWIRIQTADTMAWGARANLNESIASFPWWAALIVIVSSILLGFGLSLFDVGTSHTPNQQNYRGQGQGQYWRE